MISPLTSDTFMSFTLMRIIDKGSGRIGIMRRKNLAI